jgi:hypothetical protein
VAEDGRVYLVKTIESKFSFFIPFDALEAVAPTPEIQRRVLQTLLDVIGKVLPTTCNTWWTNMFQAFKDAVPKAPNQN